MVIKSVVPISGDYAVLASRKSDFKRPCFDQQGDGHSFFWGIVSNYACDYVKLIDIDVDGNQRVCDRCLVVPKKPCPHCNHQMEPRYDNSHDPIFWQFCPSCGFVYDMRGHEADLD